VQQKKREMRNNTSPGRLGGSADPSTFNPQEELRPSEEAFLRRGACTTKVDFDKSKSIPRIARDDLAELKIQASRLGVKKGFLTP